MRSFFVCVSLLVAFSVSFCQSDEIVFDLQELEAPKTVRELEDILLSSSDQSFETLRILNESVATCQQKLRACSVREFSLRFLNAWRKWCVATTRPEVHQLVRGISFMNISSVLLLKAFRSIESAAPDVVLIGVRRSLMREVETLRRYEGPASKLLVRSRLARVRNLLQRVLRSNLANALVQVGPKLTKKGSAVVRIRTIFQERVLAMENDLRKEFGSGETRLQEVLDILTRHNQSPKDDVLLNRQIQNLNDAKAVVSGCVMSRQCVAKGLVRVRTAAFHLWSGSSSAVHALLLSNQSAVVRACSMGCVAEKGVLQTYAQLMMNDASAYTKTVSTLYSTFCDTEQCLEQYSQALLNPDNRTFLWSAFRMSFDALPLVLTGFSDRGFALAGIAVCATMLACLVVLVGIGLAWKTLWSRLVWILLLGGVAAVLALRLYVWVNAYQVPSFDINAAPFLGGVISVTVGLFARLFGLLMVLVLLHFFGQSKALTVVWAVTGVASFIMVVSVVLVIFVTPDLAQSLSDNLGNIATRSPALNLLFVPSAVISGFTFVTSGILLSFLIFGVTKQSVVQATGKETFFGFVRMIFLVALVAVMYTVIFAISLMRLPVFGLDSQLVFVVIDVVVVESIVLVAFMLMILNSWLTSWKLISLNTRLLQSATDDDASDQREGNRYSY